PAAGADLWAWDGSAWSLISAVSPPGPRYSAHLAHDPVHKNTVLFSGALPQSGGLITPIADADDTWTFDGTTWNKQAPTSQPEPREGGGMVWDAARQRIVLFGGFSDQEALYKDAFRQ